MQLSKTEAAILEILIGGRELYGLEMVKSSDNSLKLGSIYVILGRLEEKGFVKSRKVDAEPPRAVPRRYYKLTGQGEKALRARAAAIAAINAVYGGAAA